MEMMGCFRRHICVGGMGKHIPTGTFGMVIMLHVGRIERSEVVSRTNVLREQRIQRFFRTRHWQIDFRRHILHSSAPWCCDRVCAGTGIDILITAHHGSARGCRSISSRRAGITAVH